jgi:hypothetical protein
MPGRQVILNNNPAFNLSPFAMSPGVEGFCFNANEWIAQQNQFREVAMQFGYFCLFAGVCLGLWIGWHLAKRKYGIL